MHVRIRMSQLATVMCSLSILPVAAGSAWAQEPSPPAPQEPAAPEIPKEQLDSIVAPIALYPDPLLAQVLAASTYPLEIVQLQQWLEQHKDLKDQALVDAAQKESWDPSVQAMAVLPDVVTFLAKDIKWTTDLGNAFLAQQSGVMEAVQRMRTKAQKNGTLKSSEKTKVETKTVEKETVVVIEQADPQVVYVPSYNPAVVYGPAVYPYPAIAYPPPPPPAGAVIATAAVSFGVGVMVGAAFHGGWGYNCGWGGGHNNNVVINNNNNFIKTNNARVGGVQGGVGNRGQWQHNPQHRGGAPYANQATANRYGGAAQRDAARAQAGRQAGGAERQQAAGERRQEGAGERGAKRQAGAEGRAAGGEQRADRAAAGAQPRAERGATDSNRVGNRSEPPSASAGGSRGGGDALAGGSRGSFSGSDARSSSARGSSSAGARGGGGGGGRGGGGRGGGRR